MTKTEFIDRLLPFVSKASRYLGNEVNAVRKDLSRVDLICALAFPDAYEIGMSHLGIQILYHVLNSRPDIACERVFAPWPDMESLLEKTGTPLATLESHIPLSDCDIVGFSLEYELGYATVLRMLARAGIPFRACDRNQQHPLIIAGGPSMFNPEPVAEFFDAVVIGDGEEVITDLCDAVLQSKKQGRKKQDTLEALADIAGIYVPCFFRPRYDSDGTLAEIDLLRKGYTHVTKRTLTRFSDAPCCTAPIVPTMHIIHDRAGIEIARGCTHGCRFCMAGMIYRPVREKPPAQIQQLLREILSSTGYEECALLSLSSGDYSGMSGLIRELIAEHASEKTAVSLPSLRAETLTRDLMEEIKKIRKTGFTIAPEAGTQRLRNTINKGLTEDDILKTADAVFSAGWNLIKLYFMIGLPAETDADIEGIIDLSNKIASLDRRKQINVSVSTFVPKPHTPFQWERMIPAEEIRKKQRYLKNRLSSRKIRFKWHDAALSVLEGIFSRGDRRLADVIQSAHRLGAGFDAWTEHFKPDIWDRAFAECAIDSSRYLNDIAMDQLLPWHHISCGVKTDFLKAERKKAMSASATPDCRQNGCSGCGVCADQVQNELHQSPPEPSEDRSKPYAQDEAYRYRLFFSKTGPARFLSHLELYTALTRAMRRARLPLQYSRGFHPKPRIAFHGALPVGMESTDELCDIVLGQHCVPDDLCGRLNSQLPEGIRVHAAREFTLKNKAVTDRIQQYLICFPDAGAYNFKKPADINDTIAAFLQRDTCPVTTYKKGSPLTVDIKPLIGLIKSVDASSVIVQIHPHQTTAPKITEIAAHIFQISPEAAAALRIIKQKPDGTHHPAHTT